MSDRPPLNENGLSDEDLAILRAFDAFENWDDRHSAPTAALSPQEEELEDVALDEIRALFCDEVGQDITAMSHLLHQMEQDGHLHITRLSALRRPAHKIRGTAGSIEYHLMAEIAHSIELIIERTEQGTIFPLVGFQATQHAVQALEDMLATLRTTGVEDHERYHVFEEALDQLALDFNDRPTAQETPRQLTQLLTTTDSTPGKHATTQADAETAREQTHEQFQQTERPDEITLVGLPVALARVDRVIAHAEGLVGMQTLLANAEELVEQAFQELQAAQGRLHALEGQFASHYASSHTANEPPNHPTSSLIARILGETTQRQQVARRIRLRPHLLQTGASSWDELELERDSERDSLLRAFNEVTADIAMASTRMRTAFEQLRNLTRQYSAQATTVRDDTLALRTAPFRTLVPAMRSEITHWASLQGQLIDFSVDGTETEVDQDILQGCKQILLQLIRICIADALTTDDNSALSAPHRIWLQVRRPGSEVTIELGFSMMIQGGALDAVRSSIQRLHGTILSQRNGANGVSFHIRLPHSQGAVRCLQVRVGEQHLLIPFVQVQRIGSDKREELHAFYTLGELLSLPAIVGSMQRIQPVLIVHQHSSRLVIGVAVDEVIDEIELMVRPLAAYLQRPGITGAAINGQGHVLLVVDLPELLRHHILLHRQDTPMRTDRSQLRSQPLHPHKQLLIADDSASMRQSLRQMLSQTNFVIREARDGIEALELLEEQPPDIFVLDMEMPNLNGYDLLNIMRLYPELARVKVIMLTSRASEKHRQHALELGAHTYLTKPCPQPLLLEIIQNIVS